MNKFKTYSDLILESKKSMSLPKTVYIINKLFKKENKSLYVVGGACRDFLLGIKPKDFDLATDAKPAEVISILNSAGINNFPKGEAFGVISAVTEDGEFEITTFRADLSKGRRPDAVEFTTIDKDVLRRDLTINALFYDIERKEVVDLVGGIKDLNDNIIRTVGIPTERFNEDPLRKMRALRFKAKLGAKLDPATRDALIKSEWSKNLIPSESLGSISKERIRDEFLKSIEFAKNPILYFSWLDEFRFWPFILPSPNGNNIDTSFLNKSYIDSNNVDVQLATLLKGVDLHKNTKYGLMIKKQYAYTIEQIRTIETLHFLMVFKPTDIIDIKKDLGISKLNIKTCLEFAKFNQIDKKLIQKLFDFNLSIKGDNPALNGLSGKAYGDKLKQLEAEAFENY